MLLWILIMAASIILDQITKLIVVNTMTLAETIPLIEKVFSFTRVHNYGAAWGMLSNHRWIFIAVTALAIIILPIFLYKYRKLHFLFGFSLSLIIGGAVGNMIDRVFLGYVIDFLQFTFIDFPVFNVADICVTCGAALMFIYLAFIDKTLFAETPKKKKEESTNDGTNENHSDKHE
jgi:signal peptidase II